MFTKNRNHATVLRFSGASLAVFGLAALSGCLLPTGAQVGSSNVQVTTPGQNTPDRSDLSAPAICDPFGRTESASNDQGLLAQFYYMGDTCTTVNAVQCDHYDNVAGYIQNGIHLEANLIFNQLNVPTRPYDEGVQSQNGMLILNSQGGSVYEWFGLSFDAKIKLGANDTAGKYQFAVLSDDGSIMSLDTGSGLHEWINNDGYHPSSLVCANHTVRLDAHSSLPMHLDYFQGPRYHIALVMLWRQIPDGVDETQNASVLADTACNLQGNDTFFDSTRNPSAPTGNWIGLLSRGWKVLSPDNYQLPSSVFTNPCPKGDGSCFTDSYNSPPWNTFALSETNVDPSSLKVTINGNPANFTYDATLNLVVVQNIHPGSQVKIGYCQNATSGSGPTPSPAPSSTYIPPAS